MKEASNTTPTEIEQRLAAHPFLKGMGARQLSLLAQSASPTQFNAGQVIFRTGEPANGFYLIESGNVILESSPGNTGPVIVDIVTAGEPLGWSWIFEPYHWQFDARATEPTRAICFSGILLRQHRDEDLTLSHDLFKKMCEVMVRRLQRARARLVSEKKSA